MSKASGNLLQIMKWLDSSPSLETLISRFPADWSVVEAELSKAIETKDHGRLNALMKPLDGLKKPGRGHRASKSEIADITGKLVRQRMSAAAIERFLKSSLTDGKNTSIGWLDMFIFRRLFFTSSFERKLVPSILFPILWKCVRQPNLLMPLAESHGIYCFYSKRLIEEIADTAAVDDCLEIAAGDGVLSKYLRAAGVNIKATDDYSWSQKIDIPDDVLKMDARAALKAFNPSTVICSWPPARNSFESHVFQAASVRKYIVIGSRHKFAFGNWLIYQQQKQFSMRLDAEMSRLLLPTEFGGAVYVFERR
jgi:hypothetical protein